MWTDKLIAEFHNGSTKYIEDNYVKKNYKIDCADLALSYLVDFASQNKLPVALKYYKNGSVEWYRIKPNAQNIESVRRDIKIKFGALNVIDNTSPIDVADAKSGDLIMSKWSGSLGHTRVIISSKILKSTNETEFTFYQGNLPPVVPIKKSQKFKDIDFGQLSDKRPRRWKFDSFN